MNTTEEILRLALGAMNTGDFVKSVQLTKKLLQLEANNIGALNILSISLTAMERYDEAEKYVSLVIAIDGQSASSFYNYGVILLKLGKHRQALDVFSRALELNPAHAKAWNNRGVVFNVMKQYRHAIYDFDKAISIDINYSDAYFNKGNSLMALFDYEYACNEFDRALALNPRFADAYNNRGLALQKMQRFGEALESYERAIIQKPDFADAYHNRGNVLMELKRLDEALANQERAIALKPDFAGAYQVRGSALHELRRMSEALASYEQAFRLKPDSEFLLGDICFARRKLCDWSMRAEQERSLIKGVELLKRVVQPFVVLSMSKSNALNRRAAEISNAKLKEDVRQPTPHGRHPRREKVRVGYFSADFHEHATAYLMAELFERHDKSKFDVTAFSFGPDSGGVMRKRLMAAFDRFVDVRHRTDQQVADLARSLEIDIAVDLKGFTKDNRFGIFARRAAPIQINYLGYPGTAAAAFIDYIVADKVVIPASHQDEYSERIAYLPHSYQPNDTSRKIEIARYTRTECFIPERGFVFCCFNSTYKITPDLFDCWMRILKRVPDSVLWLFADNPVAPENLRKEARKQAVDPARLIFAARIPLAEHLARQQFADLFLDTLPYNAHTTASDALWAGLPVLTEIGETFAGRVAASLLTAIGLPELIAKSQEEYETLAVDLATSPRKLSAVKDKLAKNRSTAPLFDTERYTRDLEAAYKTMYERYQDNLPPDTIYVEP